MARHALVPACRRLELDNGKLRIFCHAATAAELAIFSRALGDLTRCAPFRNQNLTTFWLGPQADENIPGGPVCRVSTYDQQTLAMQNQAMRGCRLAEP